MAIHILDQRIWFPPVTESLPDGLLAIGGDLSSERLILAYKSGIFPWYDGDIPMWWCPDPRFVLFPNELRVSKSMQSLIKRNAFQFTINKAFASVIKACKVVRRKEQDGTWITDDVEIAYTDLHKKGLAISAEVWKDNTLVGGLYGVVLGKIFFGESMFSLVSNASKYAFIQLVTWLQNEGFILIDCQVYTEHLESLGAKMIGRNRFLDVIQSSFQPK